jgi:hypothetical protein
MHFHLPKPLHGWREFAGEVAIIVLGVMIALGAEQVVENWHWRQAAGAARDSVSEEMQAQYFAASEMATAQPCIDQQLQILEKAVLAPGPYHPAPLYSEGAFRFSFRAPARAWSDDIWQSVSSDGTAAHFDRKTRLGLAAFYGLVDYLRAKNAAADVLRLRLASLSQPIQPDAGARTGLDGDIEQARGLYQIMALVSEQVIGQGEALGFRPAAKNLRAKDSGTLAFCRAHHLPLGRIDPQRPH